MEEADEAPQKPVDRELVLHYIDKLYVAYIESVHALNRAALLLIIVSLLVFGLSLGIIAVDSSFALGGLTVGANSALILITGSVFISLLLIFFFSLIGAIDSLVDKIFGLYRSVGMEENMPLGGNKDGGNKLGYAGILEIFISEMFRSGDLDTPLGVIGAIIYIGVFFLFPIIAQIAAVWRMILLFEWTWWLILSFTLIFSITMAYTVYFIKQIFS